MAGEEDVELRDLVAHTLETRGVLGRIRVSYCIPESHGSEVYEVLLVLA